MLKKYQDMNDGLPLTLSLRVRNDSPDVNPALTTSPHTSARQPSIALTDDYDDYEDEFESYFQSRSDRYAFFM